MRLSSRIIKLLKDNITKSFGSVDSYLFGSRTDENKRGGDIDIAIDTTISKEDFRLKKIRFISLLFEQEFDLKVDLVQYNQVDKLLFDEINLVKIKL